MLPAIITDKYLMEQKEDQYFERKSARIKPEDVARHLVAFSNANGGILLIGIEDDGTVTGFDYDQANDIERFESVPYVSCTGNIKVKYEERKIKLGNTEKTVLIFYIDSSEDSVVKTKNGNVFLRVGDTSKKLDHDQVRQLEYDKGERSFEDIIVRESSIDDIDFDLVEQYKKMLNTDLSVNEVLSARGLMRNDCLTHAGVLLFAKYPTKFLPNARLRLLKYDGIKMKTGQNLNIVKEINYESAIPRIIQSVRKDINLQLREFQFLDENGVFKTIPEYPEFAWFEGIVNALTHRNYSIRGEHIRVSLYDDRLEIFSPGKLPNIVTLENMQNTRYSRNPRIARVLSEFGWVKELNEGVKRIYNEMQSYYLKAPTYTEPNKNAVLLVLENSITSRHLRNDEKIIKEFDERKLEELNEYELKVIRYLYVNEKVTTKTVQEIIQKSDFIARKTIKNLVEKGLLEWHGNSAKDPTQYYTLINNEE